MDRHASLNRIYRLVWSHVHKTWVVVAETARGRGKRANRKLLLVAALAGAAQLAQAGPSGGQVTAGTGNIAQSGSTTTVNQSSQNLSLTWQSFNTSASETVNFAQPSSSAIAVNRILDTNGTQFMGHLSANGQVYLINPNGVLFGSTAQVNVGGLVASTLDLDDSTLNGTARRFSGAGTGVVTNQGNITAANGGTVAFLGNSVSNPGTITANGGTVALGAGSNVTLSFSGNRLLSMQIDGSTLNNLASNGGAIYADGGAVILTAGAKDAVLASVVNNTGTIQARSVQNVNGTIVLGGAPQSTVTSSGTLDASGTATGQKGGTVKVLGDTVSLTAGGKIDVSGDAGGGTALVGGNIQGSGPERNALSTTVTNGAAIDARALNSGNGGKVAVWSSGTTTFDGVVSAGGAGSGNGGFVQTGGAAVRVGTDAQVSTAAAGGTTGTWLIDAQDIAVGGFNPDGNVDYQAISRSLQSSNVTIKTDAAPVGHGDLVLNDGISIGAYYDAQANNSAYWTNPTTLTLSAYRSVQFTVGASIDASNGAGNVVLRADNTATGSGTIALGAHGTVYGGTGKVGFYYNPDSYSSPTPYQDLIDPDYGGNHLIVASNFNAYMLINIGATVANKTYDGTTTASVSFSPAKSMPSDITGIDTTHAVATFGDKNAGQNKLVNIDSSSVTLLGNNTGAYAINGLDNVTGTITPRNLNVSGITANTKPHYDGTTAATLAGTATVSQLDGDVVSVAGTGVGTFSDKNAGNAKAVTVSGYYLTGLDAGNYNIVQPQGLVASIGKADVTVTGVTVATKTYDRTTTATLSGNATVPVFGSDQVSVQGGSAAFADRNVGAGKAVTASGFFLTGTDAGNYNIQQPSGLTGTITKAGLTISGLTAVDKTYDATNTAMLSGAASVTPIAGDVVSVSGSGSATFSDKNAGSGKTVIVNGGYTLAGADAANYSIVLPTNLTATIGKADLVLAGLGIANKTYDGTVAATLLGSPSVTPIGSDIVSLSGTATANFLDKNVGTGKHVSLGGLTLGGADGGNYNLVAPSSLVADVTKADVVVTGVSANSKTYDRTTTATLSGVPHVAALANDELFVSGLDNASASFANKDAGTGKAVLVNGFTLAGADAANYNIVQPSGLHADILKADLLLGGLTVADKRYDATTSATLSGSASVTPIAGDDVSVSGIGSATFADKNAGMNKPVNVSGYALSGLDAANYNLVQAGGLSANIAKADLAVSGVTANNKTYNGDRNATLSGTAIVTALQDDVVSVSGTGTGTFADKNAGTGKAVTVAGFTLVGTDAANYNVVQPTGLVADIAKADLAVTGVSANNKTYDATRTATLSGTATVAAFGSDVVSVSGGTASFADKNAGSGKAVTVSGFTLSGLDAANYNVVQPSGLHANIDKASLQLGGIAVADKVYDATTTATLTGSASVTPLGHDDVAVSGSGSAVFADKNAGGAKAVNVSGYTLSGADAGNYELLQVGGLTANIARADLAVSGVTANNKVYDATTAATLSGAATVNAFVGDHVAVAGMGTASFADKNAGSGKQVNVDGYTLTGADAANYNVVQPAGLHADIARAGLAVTGVNADNKTYDGTTAATLSGNAAVAAIGNDAVTVNGGSAVFADKNAGSGKLVTASGFTLSGADAGNYDVVQPAGLHADIGKANLQLGGIGVADKVYDGTVAATLTGSASVTPIGSDVVAVSGSGSAVFADKNAGSGKLVTVSGYTLSGADAGNYALQQVGGLTANIAKADLAVTGVTANNKVYDGGTAATLSGTAIVNAIAGDAVALTGNASAAFADKNAGSGKLVTAGGYALSGADAANYNLVQPTGLRADIARADLAVTGVSANNKVYDGTVAATLSGNATVAAFGADAVTVNGGSAVFADKNAGAGKLVVASGYTLGGADAANYNVVQPGGLSANIDKALLGVSGVSANNKTYDGTVAATLSGTAGVNAIAGDAVALKGNATAAFADKNAGSGKLVTVSGYGLSGADAGNYQLLQPTGLTADIGKADLAVTGVTANNKVYDGGTAATLSGTAAVNAIAGDAVALTGNASAAFADKNAGSGKLVTVGGYALSGADAANYNLVQPTGLRADIARADLAVTGVSANNKVYDGTVAATLSGSASVAAFGNDEVSVGGVATAVFADKNAGSGKQVAVSGYTLAGADAANYNVVQPGGLSANIDKALLAVSGVSANNKTYDGTAGATLSGTAGVNAIAGDAVALGGNATAAFADKNAGSGKAVNISGYTLTGADAGNYQLVQPGGLTATIARADLAVTGVNANGKVYDGGTAATLSGTAAVNAIAGDAVALGGNARASFADKNVGSAKRVTVDGYALSGVDAANYNLVQPGGLTASITPATITVSGIRAVDKSFDGTTAATVNTGGAVLAGKVNGDAVTLASTGAFLDGAAGNGKTVKLSNVYGGADLANYTIVDQATALASISQKPQQIDNAVAQVLSAVLAAPASAQPQSLNSSTTLLVSRSEDDVPAERGSKSGPGAGLVNTTLGFGPGAPRLQIQNGGMHLPPLATSTTD